MDVGVDSTHCEYTQDRLGVLYFAHRRDGEHVCVIFNQLAVNSVLVRSDDDLYAADDLRSHVVCR